MTRVLAPSARPFIAYQIPPERRQVTRAPAARDAFRDSAAFIERCAKRLGPERSELGLSVCGSLDAGDGHRLSRLDEARRQAIERFGAPVVMPGGTFQTRGGPRVFPNFWGWTAPLAHADAALAWLEQFPDCDGYDELRGWVHVTCGCVFWLRDPTSGKLLPGQRSVHRAPVYWHSGLSLTLQAVSTIEMTLVLPFEEPAAAARSYVAWVRPHLPAAFDPTAFWHYVPRADRSKYDKRQLPPDWFD